MQILAVHIDRPFLRIALVEKTRGRTEIISLKSPLLEEPEIVKRLYNAPFKGKIISGLPAKHLLIRSSEIKTTSPRHLEQALSFQAETITHLSPKETLFIPYITKHEKDKTKALIFAISRKTMHEHLDELQKFDIDPDFVSAIPLALVRYIQWKIPSLSDAFIIDIGSEEWTCIWMEDRKLQKAHSTEKGIESLFEALWEDRKKIIFQKEIKGIAKQIDLLQLQGHLNPHLSNRLNEMKQSLMKILYSFHRLSGPKSIIFTGRIDAFGHLKEYLLKSLTELCSGEYEREVPLEEQKYAAAIGLALDSSLQFRREEFFPQKNWKRAGIYSLFLLFLSFFLSFGLIKAGKWALSTREQAMVNYLKNSLAYDADFKNIVLSKKDTDEILNFWARTIAANAKDYPYIVQVPAVSEILHWLDHHPLLTAFKSASDPIEITTFDYKLVTFPTLQSTKEPYLAKVEMEFKTTNALNARQFHEALLQEKNWIDSSQEISWESNEDSYRVGFFLKKQDRSS